MNRTSRKKILAFVMALCMAFAILYPAPASALSRSEKMLVGETKELRHYASFSWLTDYYWELTEGSGVVLITSGSTSRTCTVQALAPGKAVVKGTAEGNRNTSYTHTFTITVEEAEYSVRLDANGGTVSPSKVKVTDGHTYGTLPTPERSGYVFDGWYTSQTGGIEIRSDSTVDLDDDAVFYAHWTQIPQPVNPPVNNGSSGGSAESDGSSGTAGTFSDVSPSAYYYDAVEWAFKKGVTTGKTDSLFAPFDGCTRGNVVTFLWRAMGKPAPASRVNPFSDVAAGSYYYDSVLWAVENGVTQGTSASTFSPGQSCTKGHIVTFLYRTMGEPGKTGTGAYYSDAVRWGESQGMFAGTGAAFSASDNCSRADAVTYLYRAVGQTQTGSSPSPANSGSGSDSPSQSGTSSGGSKTPTVDLCSTCGGTGDCPSCFGEGHNDCTALHCMNGMCLECSGTGTILSYSYGQIKERNCTYCRGTGDCQRCGGNGVLECSRCHGTGTCPTCHGTGQKA